jgi:predicted permease
VDQVSLAINQIIILGLIGLTGFAAGRRRWLPDNASTALSQVIVKITLPALILTTMSGYSFSRKVLTDGAWVFILSIVFLSFGFLVSTLACRMLKLPADTCNIYRMLSILGNIGFLAFPIINSMYGEKGILYSVFYMIVNDTAIWTVGVYFLNRHNSSSIKSDIRHFVNPNTISFVIGILFIITNFQGLIQKSDIAGGIYSLLYNAFSPLGKTTSYLAMLFIGLILSEVKISSFSDIIKRYPIFILTFTKMLFVPTCALAVLTLLGSFVDPFVKSIVVLLLAMPSASLVPVLAAQFKTDYRFAAEAIFITTLLGTVTIPCMLLVIKLFSF